MEINSVAGTKLQDPEDIKYEFLQFYKSLMGLSTFSLSVVHKHVMQKGSVLTRAQKLKLCSTLIRKFMKHYRILEMTRHHVLMGSFPFAILVCLYLV